MTRATEFHARPSAAVTSAMRSPAAWRRTVMTASIAYSTTPARNPTRWTRVVVSFGVSLHSQRQPKVNGERPADRFTAEERTFQDVLGVEQIGEKYLRSDIRPPREQGVAEAQVDRK